VVFSVETDPARFVRFHRTWRGSGEQRPGHGLRASDFRSRALCSRMATHAIMGVVHASPGPRLRRAGVCVYGEYP
jgi:hypothetical protein